MKPTITRPTERTASSTGSRERERPDNSTGSRERKRPDNSTGSRERKRPDNCTGSRERKRPVIEVSEQRLREAAACFNITTFRESQREVIEAVLQGRDALAVLPPGAGKSVCYQLPALFLPTLTVIVTPGFALATTDQVEHIHHWPDPTPALVYVTPERLQTEDCIELLQLNGVSRLVIDEAHRASRLGHDFHPAHAAIARVAARLGNPPILALTTTATAETAQDITRQLALHDPLIVRPDHARRNLSLEVLPTPTESSKRKALEQILERETGQGIIYCTTAREAEKVQALLGARCVSAGSSQGHMREEQREAAEAEFKRGDTRLLIATGRMGAPIEKRNIRFVLHWTLPDSLETYWQQASQAGRDGAPATAYLLYRQEDRALQARALTAKYPTAEERRALARAAASVSERIEWSINDLSTTTKIPLQRLERILSHLDREAIATTWESTTTFHPKSKRALATALATYTKRPPRDHARLAAMLAYAETTSCRTAQIQNYFGVPSKADCTHCDTCRARSAGERSGSGAPDRRSDGPGVRSGGLER